MKIFASLYTDEDIANLVATLLKSRGLDVLTTLDAEMTGYSDAEQLAYAAEEKRCLLTHNRVDYERLHLSYIQTKQQHSGIIITPQNNAYEVAKRVGIILNTLTADEIFNQLLYV
ncbi:MAG: DUF5615 family PIN-like protein [Oscillatoria sp. PMC 1051.18]|uniref:DUF5615 family PIN-like protein n=1 Tax=Oscillatoria salina TaxID=331517 RepID=UPI0013BCFE1D|nr:DUF5615 family PIN-like protein [Oscillatoria salina]MBZ8179523.1 hypothetical protein [Oscillatoria salina IIICB1]MEC4891479.1 DUF5615 family PIN-like protein [Oscillatoria sp. PMC 1050.18]MEC5029628.1 DUF5615 family PIN-like protein [Oscillatoria sp. PMC 1051.18]NET91006.1 hypothetical protein [Kamptonema sp. SIO1D9]